MPTKKVAYITNAGRESGVGRAAFEIAQRLSKQGEFELDQFFLAASQKIKPIAWWQKSRALPKRGYALWHFTNQTLAFIRRRPAIVTVHDLIELTDPQTPLGRLAATYLYSGLARAAHLICVSQYTRRVVQEKFQVASEKISVIPEAASEIFQPDPGARQTIGALELRQRLNLSPQNKLVLYVGSEHPRKNLPVLVQAFAQVQKKIPEAIFIKVGAPGLAAGRQALLAALDEFRVREATRLIHNISDEDLKLLYNLADVFVFPSRLEGFGLPPLEALACGCPVVCSKATSLPEVVGDAALLHAPDDIQGFTNSIERVLTDPNLAHDLRRRGPAQAAKFSWDKSAQETLEVYCKVTDIV